MDELPRLRDEDSALGEALRDAGDQGPSNAQRDKIAAGLAGILGPSPGGPPPGAEAATSGAAATSSSALLKWAAAACFMGGAVWWGVQETPAPDLVASAPAVHSADPEPADAPLGGGAGGTNVRTETQPRVPQPIEAQPIEAQPIEAQPIEAHAQTELAPSTSPVAAYESVRARSPRRAGSPAEARSPSSHSSTSSLSTVGTSTAAMVAGAPSANSSGAREEESAQTEPVEQQLSELSLLAEARRVLRRAPAQTLQLTNQHRTRFDSGALVEEREVLAIEALVRLSRHSQANTRAERFRQRFPRSIHATRISAILAP